LNLKIEFENCNLKLSLNIEYSILNIPRIPKIPKENQPNFKTPSPSPLIPAKFAKASSFPYLCINQQTMLRTIIIEDEEQKRLMLRQMLIEMRPDVEIVGEAIDVISGVKLIKKSKPDLVFLDIELPDGTGFDILEKVSGINFKIIFVTAYSEYAVRAFKFSAVDYLLKPVSVTELMEAIDKAVHMLIAEYNLKINTLLNNHHSTSNEEKRIILKTIDKVHVIKIQRYCSL